MLYALLGLEPSIVLETVGNLFITTLEDRREDVFSPVVAMRIISVAQQECIRFMFPITSFVKGRLYSFLNYTIKSLMASLLRAITV